LGFSYCIGENYQKSKIKNKKEIIYEKCCDIFSLCASHYPNFPKQSFGWNVIYCFGRGFIEIILLIIMSNDFLKTCPIVGRDYYFLTENVLPGSGQN